MTNSASRGAPGTVLISIATASHLALAVEAVSSARAEARALRRVVCLVGARRVAARDYHGVEIVHAEDFVDAAAFEEIVSRYTPAEVCFALKPYVMDAFANGPVLFVHYVDADIRFFSDIQALEDCFGAGDILLTPHYLQPYPDDGRRPGMLTLLRGGVFNAGYVAVRNTAGAKAFLRWWADRVRRAGENNPAKGTSGDQRWLDLVPVLFPGLSICRHPGANVAYWNLHERAMGEENGLPTSNGQALLFFHFSGFRTDTPLVISKYQDRINASTNPTLAGILEAYAREAAAVETESAGARYAYWRWWHGSGYWATRTRQWLRRRKAYR